MALEVERQDNKFRVVTQHFSTGWLPDSTANCKVVVILLKGMRDARDKKLFIDKELVKVANSKVANSKLKNKVSKYIKYFKDCEEDFRKMLTRKRKIDEKIVDCVEEILRKEPLLTLEEIANKINKKLNRNDMRRANVEFALEQISYQKMHTVVKKQLEQGKTKYKEEFLIQRLFEMAAEPKKNVDNLPVKEIEQLAKTATPAIELSKVQVSEDESLPEAAEELFAAKTNKQTLSKIWESSLGWKLWVFILYFNGVSLSVIAHWLDYNKSSLSRWLSEVAKWGNAYLIKIPKIASYKIAIDEKFITIAGKFWYLFVAVDCLTGCPLWATIYPSNNGNYCKLFLLELKKLGYFPKAIITDGHDAYIQAILDIFPSCEHLYCRFHVIRSVFRRLRKAFIFDAKIYNSVSKLFHTNYKRTVLRRMESLKNLIPSHSLHVLNGLQQKLPQVIKAIGSTWRPSTANAAELFFCKFERFYRLKGPFQNFDSAQKHLTLFMLAYLFLVGKQFQPCPLEKIGCNVSKIPFYHLVNKPDIRLLKNRMIA